MIVTFTFSPFGNVVQKTSDHMRMPVVSRSEPPRHEKPSSGEWSSPIQAAALGFLEGVYWKTKKTILLESTFVIFRYFAKVE